jgi:hypothetical protein
MLYRRTDREKEREREREKGRLYMKIYKKDCEFCPLAFCVQHSSISLASPFFYSSSAERRTRDLGSSAERVSRPPALIHTQHARRRRKNNRKEEKKMLDTHESLSTLAETT